MSNTIENLRTKYNEIVRENDRRIAVRDSLHERLDKEYGTHDLKELEALRDEMKEQYERDLAAYNKKVAEIEAYIEEKQEELNG